MDLVTYVYGMAVYGILPCRPARSALLCASDVSAVRSPPAPLLQDKDAYDAFCKDS